jgi:GNAT superfamily N-acetyltransferase
MQVRCATLDDIAAVAHVHVESWRTTYAQLLPADALAALSPEQRTPMWQRVLADASQVVAVAVDGTAIVGFASAGSGREPTLELSHDLHALYLLASHQRRGLGRRLVHAVVEPIVTGGARGVVVRVLRDNPAREFYARLGGELIATVQTTLLGVCVVEEHYAWRDPRVLLEPY